MVTSIASAANLCITTMQCHSLPPLTRILISLSAKRTNRIRSPGDRRTDGLQETIAPGRARSHPAAQSELASGGCVDQGRPISDGRRAAQSVRTRTRRSRAVQAQHKDCGEKGEEEGRKAHLHERGRESSWEGRGGEGEGVGG